MGGLRLCDGSASQSVDALEIGIVATLGKKDAFAKYGATLRNVQWSVSAWAPDGALVVSLWAHHHREGPAGSSEYADKVSRWSGPGNQEFCENLARALKEKSDVRLVVATTKDAAYVESGQDASQIKKQFHVRQDLIGRVVEYDGDAPKGAPRSRMSLDFQKSCGREGAP